MLHGKDVWDAKEHVVQWDVKTLNRVLERQGFTPVRSFAPRPVQTTNSPLGARVARSAIYHSAQLLGGQHRVPIFAQDIFAIAQKTP
jgi:hypothetical protein